MKLSIITINKDNGEGLERTLNSVLNQSYTELEHIIIDGGSSDNSVEVIKRYVEKVKEFGVRGLEIVWLSEPDSGIYNAMNKGIKMSHGEYTLMLNSGDFLVNGHTIEQILPELEGMDIVQGNVLSMKDGKEIVNRGYGKSDISFIDVMGGYFVHQASFCRKELFSKYGYFDESYKINGDIVFYAKCLAFGDATFKYVDQNVAYFDTTGISADPEGKWVALRKSEDARYAQLYTKRMWDLFYKSGHKIRLYDNLHRHKWSWYITMAIAKLLK